MLNILQKIQLINLTLLQELLNNGELPQLKELIFAKHF